MTFIGIDNSIGWAHWQLKGGWKSLLISIICYVAVVGGLVFASIHMTNPRYPGNVTQVYATWRIVLLYLEAAILTLFAGSRIAVAIRSDVANHMAESHSLMPIPALSAISGYLWGPAAQPVGLMLANFVIGVLVCLEAGYGIGLWMGPTVVLIVFAVFCWVTAAYSALVSRLGWGGVFGALIAVGFSQGHFLPYVPALMVLASPFIGNSIFRASVTNYQFEPAIFVSFLAEIALGVLLYLGAARKYERADQTALGIVLSLLLLLLWVGCSFIGMQYLDDFQARGFYGLIFDSTDLVQVVICGIASAMIIALILIANSARDRRLGGSSPLIAIGCAVIISMLSFALDHYLNPSQGAFIYTFLAVASFLVSVCYLLRIAYRVMTKAWVLVLFWMVIAWLFPILVDYTLWAMSESTEEYSSSVFTAISPFGLITLAWHSNTNPDVMLAIGSGVQIAIALGWMLLFTLTQRRFNAVGNSNQVRADNQGYELQSEGVGADGAHS